MKPSEVYRLAAPNVIIARLKSSSFIRNTLIVASGSAIAQAIGFSLTPIISRLFTPADFGVFGAFGAVAAFIAAGVTLEYSQAIMLPKDNNSALHLFLVSCIVTLIITSLLTLICFIAPLFISRLIGRREGWILALLVLSVLVTGFNVALQAWSVRAKAFRHTSSSQVIRSISSNSMQISFGLFNAGYAGLIFSAILADLIASINLLKVFLLDFKTFMHSISWMRVKQVAREYRDFPLYSASQNIINSLSSGLPVIMLTHFFGVGVAGSYIFALHLLTNPMGLITRAMRQVLFQKASETQHQGGSLSSLYLKVTGTLFVIAILPVLIMLIWAPQIFAFVFGDRWHEAGGYARYMILWMLFVFCNVPAVLFARLIRIQRVVFLYDLLLLAIRLSVLTLGGFYFSALNSVMLFSIVGALMNLGLIVLVGRIVLKSEGRISPNPSLFNLSEKGHHD